MTAAGRFVVFSLDGGRYALALASVERVVRAVEITPLPGAPAAVMGVIDAEGEVIPVYNLRRRFGRPEREVAPADHYLIARTGGKKVALVIDDAQGVAALAGGESGAGDGIFAGLGQVRGALKLPDGLVLIQDLDRFLSPDEADALEAALAPAAGKHGSAGNAPLPRAGATGKTGPER